MLNVTPRPPVLSPMISPMTEQKEFIPKEVEPSPIISSSPIIISTAAAVNKIDEVNEVVNEKMLDPFAELAAGPNTTAEEVKKIITN